MREREPVPEAGAEDEGKTTVVREVAPPARGKPSGRFADLRMTLSDPVEERLPSGEVRLIPGT